MSPLDPDLIRSPSSPGSRVGFAARAARGFALDTACGRRGELGIGFKQKNTQQGEGETSRFAW